MTTKGRTKQKEFHSLGEFGLFLPLEEIRRYKGHEEDCLSSEVHGTALTFRGVSLCVTDTLQAQHQVLSRLLDAIPVELPENQSS